MIVIEFINKEIVNLSRIDAKVEVTTNIVTSNILFISTKYRTESGEITTIGRVTDKRDPVTDECRNRLYNIFIKP